MTALSISTVIFVLTVTSRCDTHKAGVETREFCNSILSLMLSESAQTVNFLSYPPDTILLSLVKVMQLMHEVARQQ